MVAGRTKPGRKLKGQLREEKIENPLAEDYERWGLPMGLTVQEWEERHGWPPYTVYPEAKLVLPTQVGYFMYRIATEEEKEAMQKKRGKQRGKVVTLTEQREKNRQRYRKWYYQRRYRYNQAAKEQRKAWLEHGKTEGVCH